MAPFVLVRVYRDGVPQDLQEYTSLDSALDERDRREKERFGFCPFYGVCDKDDEERGWLDWDSEA